MRAHAGCLVLMSVLGIATAHAETKVPEGFIHSYASYALKAPEELPRCVELLAKVIADGKDDKSINIAMRAQGCFDAHTFVGGDDRPGYSAKRAGVLPVTQVDTRISLSGSVLVLHIHTFDDGLGETLERFLAAIPPMALSSVTDVVINYLDNRGGSIRELTALQRLFAPRRGMRFMRTETRCPDVPPFQTTKMRGPLANKRYWILVNGLTASAAVISAGEMLIWYPDAATIVGLGDDRTDPKIVMQTHIDDDTQITCGRWVAPDPGIGTSGLRASLVLPRGVCKGEDDECLVKRLPIARLGATAQAQ